MTPEEFEKIRAEALGELNDAADRRRVLAVPYLQAVINLRDGLPLFGWHPSVPVKNCKMIMASIARLRGYRAQSIH